MPPTMEDKLKKRKLDALRRGIHRANAAVDLPFSVNVVGIGRAGAAIVAEVLLALPAEGPPMAALVIDIGDGDLAAVRAAATALRPGRAEVEIVALPVPSRADLRATMVRYRSFLTLEYPMFAWEGGGGWLPEAATAPPSGGGVPRAYAKALYGRAYYDGDRPLRGALRRFGARVEAGRAQAMVCVAFGIAGGTGSGIGIDLARHLSNVVFGRQALTVGIGILPCAGDGPADAGLFAALNELDGLDDEAKNAGIVASCGELFRNPFTAGFLAVPQSHVWAATHDLAATHARVTAEVASLLTARGGANLWETLRLLNWVAAPSTQHSAARTPWGAKWLHLLGFGDTVGTLSLGAGLRGRLGLLPSYRPEYIELRAASPEAPEGAEASARLDEALTPDVAPQVTGGGHDGGVQFLLPSVAKTDLDLFVAARDAYDAAGPGERLLAHSLLLEQGVLLSEPSTRLDGMAGAGIHGGDGWVAVPLADLRGEARPFESAAPAARVA